MVATSLPRRSRCCPPRAQDAAERASALPRQRRQGGARRLRGGRGNSLRSGSRAAGGCPSQVGGVEHVAGAAGGGDEARPLQLAEGGTTGSTGATPSRSAIFAGGQAGRPLRHQEPEGGEPGFLRQRGEGTEGLSGFSMIFSHLGISKQKVNAPAGPPPCAGPAGGPGPKAGRRVCRIGIRRGSPRAEAGNGDPAGPAGGRSPRTVPAGRQRRGGGRPIDRARPAGRSLPPLHPPYQLITVAGEDAPRREAGAPGTTAKTGAPHQGEHPPSPPGSS